MRLNDFNLRQCFFGEHLLTSEKGKPVTLVESEKTALVCSIHLPHFTWVASGGKNGCLNEECLSILRGRTVSLFPDLGATDYWRSKIPMMRQLGIHAQLYDYLERAATDEQRKQGLSKLIPPAEVENGLASRFLFVKMPPTDGMPLRKRNRDDKRLELIRAEGQRMCETGSSPHVNEAFEIRLPRTNKALDAWDAEKIEDYKQCGNVAIDALRKRAALIGFRADMIARCLEGRETKAVVDFGLWVAQEAFLSQMAYCGDEVQKADEINSRLARKSERTLRRSKNTRIFDELPEKFEKKDLQALRAKMGYGDKECSYILTRWQQDNRVRREGTWFYKL